LFCYDSIFKVYYTADHNVLEYKLLTVVYSIDVVSCWYKYDINGTHTRYFCEFI